MVTIALVSAGAQTVRLASAPDTRRRPCIRRVMETHADDPDAGRIDLCAHTEEIHRVFDVIDFLAAVVDREVVHAAVPGRAAMVGCTATTRVSLREP